MGKNVNAKKGSGVLAGIIFLFIGIAVLWYNEGRTVKTQSAINEAMKQYVDVKSNKVDSKNEGKLVATKGKIDLTSADILTDGKFGINTKSAKMLRTVETYQWEESCTTDDDDKQTCTYEKVWKDELIDSSEFKESGHSNPVNQLYENEFYISSNVFVGAFELPEELIKNLEYNKKVNNDQLLAQYNNSDEKIKVDGNYLTDVKDNAPEIGNIRISYKYLDSETVSIMAVQRGNSFEAFTSKKGKDIYIIRTGNYTGRQILENMTKTNKGMKWFLRILGTVLVISSISSMFGFINTLANKVPILGNIVNGTTSIISGVLGLGISLVVIAIAWFRFRPVLSIILIAVVVALLVFLKFYKKDEKKDK